MNREYAFKFKLAYSAIAVLALWAMPFLVEWVYVRGLGKPSPFKSGAAESRLFLLGLFLVIVWLAIELLAWLASRSGRRSGLGNRQVSTERSEALQEGIDIEIAERNCERKRRRN